jgi:hypothetical protein
VGDISHDKLNHPGRILVPPYTSMRRETLRSTFGRRTERAILRTKIRTECLFSCPRLLAFHKRHTPLLLLLRDGIARGVPNSAKLSGSNQQTPSSKVWRNLVRNGREFCRRSIFHTPQGSLTCHKISRHGADDFAFPPKEVVLRIFIALKNPSSSAGFEPMNFRYNGNHDNH